MAFEIWINRVYANTGSNIGRVYASGDALCYSLELPWKDNQSNVSCVLVGSETKAGPFMNSSLPVAGFAVIEAANLAEAVTMVSKTPCAVAHGVVEVWPLEEAP